MAIPHRITHIAAGWALLLTACSPADRGGQQAGPAAPPAVPVSVATAARTSIPNELRVVGTVEASATVQVMSQVPGQLVAVRFREGENVARGALLFEIDKRPYQHALRQAEAALARDQALVQQAQATLARDHATLRNAEAEHARNSEMLKAGVISRSQYDQARTASDVARESVRAGEAAIETARAAVENDRAAVDRAKLDLSYCDIRAPISGRTGILLVHPGNNVKVSDVPLVVIHQVTPIVVTFSAPEQHLNAVRKFSAAGRLPVRVSVQDDPGRVATGHVTAIENTVDRSTGTIRLKAQFDNSGGMLWPGQFVNVVLTLDTLENATAVPSEAVQAGAQGQFVYVVKTNKSVEMRPVTTGLSADGRTAIAQGIAPGEVVVTDGHLRLFPGATVKTVAESARGVAP